MKPFGLLRPQKAGVHDIFTFYTNSNSANWKPRVGLVDTSDLPTWEVEGYGQQTMISASFDLSTNTNNDTLRVTLSTSDYDNILTLSLLYSADLVGALDLDVLNYLTDITVGNSLLLTEVLNVSGEGSFNIQNTGVQILDLSNYPCDDVIINNNDSLTSIFGLRSSITGCKTVISGNLILSMCDMSNVEIITACSLISNPAWDENIELHTKTGVSLALSCYFSGFTGLDLTAFDIVGGLTAYDMPNLTTITGLHTVAGGSASVYLRNNTHVTSIDLSNFVVSGYIYLYNYSALTSLTGLNSVLTGVTGLLHNNALLTEIDLSNIYFKTSLTVRNSKYLSLSPKSAVGESVTLSAQLSKFVTLDLTNFDIKASCQLYFCYDLETVIGIHTGVGFSSNLYLRGSTLLTGIDLTDFALSGYIYLNYNNNNVISNFKSLTNNMNIDFTSNAYTQANVDLMLSHVVATGVTATTAFLNIGGTNATPSASGLADVVTLESRGWLVTHT